MNKFIILVLLLGWTVTVHCQQSDLLMIEETLQKYIVGSTEGQPKLLQEAFYPDLNLYYVKNDSIMTWSGVAYIADTKEGKPTGENGKILSVDFETNAAVAKVEIAHPKSKTSYVDYFMLLKTEGKWTIVHKMFTKRKSLFER